MTYWLGLTGGIATGKSTVAAVFKQRGCPVVDADVIAHQVMAPGEPVLQEIAAAFGADVLTPDGALNRKRLGALIFADSAKRRQLDAIDQPHIRVALKRALDEAAATGAPVIVGDIPLMYETNWDKAFDGVAVVTLPESVQLTRLMARDGLSEAAAQARIEAQMPLREKVARADFLIDNSRGQAIREKQVDALLKAVTKMA
ncbi:dephospho-CoA kinase [Lacticaseibacillus mingshuiensis]|uniref:Dephospho-CoA kinase n=1 Tax=Lacticaseibacillus mingshuiensis TaxID=2799574 RepID=A0ABW4CGB9_9LACO|nr:dephospho-CoA kinase [Lacticaseibacillus mingshuiensis]